jgi:hypothetical protein
MIRRLIPFRSNSLGLALTSIIFFTVGLAITALAQVPDGKLDSYCTWATSNRPNTTVYHVDWQGFRDAYLQGGTSDVSTRAVRLQMDRFLQDWTAASRAPVRFRVHESDAEVCGVWGAKSCIVARTDNQDFKCRNEPIAGYADCGPTGACHVVLCSDNNQFNREAFVREKLRFLVQHEFGHAVAHKHLDDGGSTTCTTGVETNCGFNDNDGCEGEMMCSRSNCSSVERPTFGDTRGARRYFSNSENPRSRRLYSALYPTTSTTVAPPGFTLASPAGNSVYTPRLDCPVWGAGSPCATVRVETLSTGATRLRVYRLSNWTSSGGWTVSDLRHNSSILVNSEPDIAVDWAGLTAFILFEDSSTHTLFLRRIDLQTGATVASFALLGISSPRGPARLAFAPFSSTLILATFDSTESQISLYRFAPYASTPGFVDVDAFGIPIRLNGFMHPNFTPQDVNGSSPFAARIVGPFDLACRPNYIVETDVWRDDCIIVAPRRHSNDTVTFEGRAMSFAFALQSDTSPAGNSPVVLSAGWGRGNFSGIDHVDSVSLSPTHVFVTYTPAMESSVFNNNARVSRHLNLTVSQTQSSALFVADAQGCATSPAAGGDLVPAMSTNSFATAAWCEWCVSGGALVGYSLGRRDDGSDFCH